MDDPVGLPAQRDRSARVKLRDDEVLALVVRAQNNDRQAFGELYRAYSRPVFRYIRNRLGDEDLAEDLTSEAFLRALRGIRGFKWQGHGIHAWLLTIARNLVTDHLESAPHLREVLTAQLPGAGCGELDLDDLATALTAELPQDCAPGDRQHASSGGIDLAFVQDCDPGELAAQLGIATVGGYVRRRSETDLLVDRAVEHTLTELGADVVVTAEQFTRELDDAVLRLAPRQQECLILRSFHGWSTAQTAWIMGVSEGSVKMLQLRAVRSLAAMLRRHRDGSDTPRSTREGVGVSRRAKSAIFSASPVTPGTIAESQARADGSLAELQAAEQAVDQAGDRIDQAVDQLEHRSEQAARVAA